MPAQTRIILSFFIPLFLALFGLALSPGGRAQAAPPEHFIYLPAIADGKAQAQAALGFELTDNFVTWYAAELEPFHLSFVRANLGNVSDPSTALYQQYLAGGWAAADARMLPNLDGWRALGAEPLFIFMPGGECAPPSYALLDDFADFIAAAVERYDLDYFEVWNEPDAKSGASSLYGCLGPDHTGKLIYLLERIRPQLDPQRQMGVSFALGNADHLEMLAQVAPHLDFVGIHHYGVWGGGQVLESDWPGSLVLKYQLAQEASGLPVWITELNLRSPGDECGPAHQAAARSYIEAALELDAPMISILVYKSYPDWQCTGIRDTLLGDMLVQQRAGLAP